MAIKVLGVGGSMREDSHSTRAIRLCLESARQRGAEVQLLDLRTADLPMFRPYEEAPAAMAKIADLVRWPDAFVLGSPDYHGSMSGAMKNFLDFHWEEFAGKLFGYVCASHEKGLTVMEQMRTAVRQCYGWSLPYGVSIHGEQDFDNSGAISNARLRDRLEMLARDLTVYGTLIYGQFIRDLDDRSPDTFAARYVDLG
jgi:NAD(P)H-dependent FMN reductase